jgi:hypothetical protein
MTNIEGAVRASSESISQDIDGIYTATYVCTGDYFKLIKFARKQKDHPTMDDLIRTNYGVQRLDGTLGRATLTFKGVFKDEEYLRYNLNSNTQTEPIPTHPFFDEGTTIPDGREEVTADDAYGYRFGDQLIGTPDGSKQAFYEDQNGSLVFRHFPADADFDLQGVTSYLNIGMTLNLIIVTYAKDNYETKLGKKLNEGGYAFAVGQIVDPPSKIAPKLSTIMKDAGSIKRDHSWMVTKCNVEIVGSAMRQDVELTLSGYKGWNKLVYNKYTQDLGVNDDKWKQPTISND